MDQDLIKNTQNLVWDKAFGLGRNNSISLHTDSSHIYRVTGISQVKDIIYSGYIKSRSGKVKGGKRGVVYWSKGGPDLFFFDKRPVIEIHSDSLKDNSVGALPIESLTAVWIFDQSLNSYQNRLELVLALREFLKDKDIDLSFDSINAILESGVFTPENKEALMDNIDGLMTLKDELNNEESKKL